MKTKLISALSLALLPSPSIGAENFFEAISTLTANMNQRQLIAKNEEKVFGGRVVTTVTTSRGELYITTDYQRQCFGDGQARFSETRISLDSIGELEVDRSHRFPDRSGITFYPKKKSVFLGGSYKELDREKVSVDCAGGHFQGAISFTETVFLTNDTALKLADEIRQLQRTH